MFSNSGVIFAVPPPPIVKFNEHLPDGQTIIDDFIKRRQGYGALSEVQTNIQLLKRLKGQLVGKRDTLDDPESHKESEDVGVVTQGIEKVLGNLENLKARKKKDNKKKKRKRKSSVDWKKLHQEIDEWREGRHQRLLREAEIEAHSRQWGRSLRDNSVKIQETRSLLARLESALVKIRSADHLNEEAAEKTSQLITVWRDALSEYFQEKSTLGLKLGVQPQDIQSNESRKCWSECLFGNTYELRNSSFENFLIIRSEWDRFASNSYDATQIPSFYVLPPPNPSGDHRSMWSQYKCSL